MVCSMEKNVEILSVQQKLVIGQLLVLSATGEIFNHVDHDLPMWSGKGDRKITVHIVFHAPFAAPPLVTLGLAGIDSAHNKNLRVWLVARDVAEAGFSLECRTWGDTRIARASVSWHAIGQVRSAD